MAKKSEMYEAIEALAKAKDISVEQIMEAMEDGLKAAYKRYVKKSANSPMNLSVMISRDKDKPEIRYMFPVKSSLAPEGSVIAFSITRENGISWLGQRELDKNVVESCNLADSKKKLAVRIIQDVLYDHDVLSADIMRKLKIMDISERTINTAKKSLGIVSYRKDGVWYWRLPDGNSMTDWRVTNGK